MKQLPGIADPNLKNSDDTADISAVSPANTKSIASKPLRLALAWILFLNIMCGLDTDATNVIIQILLPLS